MVSIRSMLSAAILAALMGAANAQSADDIAAGMSIFQQKGACLACHGWAGDGRKVDSQMPDGANLRALQIDRDVLTMTIRCGRPGTGMPAFERLAYSDGRCYGLSETELSRLFGLVDPNPQSCMVCHSGQAPSLKPFDPKEAMQRIDHWTADRAARKPKVSVLLKPHP